MDGHLDAKTLSCLLRAARERQKHLMEMAEAHHLAGRKTELQMALDEENCLKEGISWLWRQQLRGM